MQKQVPGSPSSQAGPFTPGGPFPQTPGHPGSTTPSSHTPAVGGATPTAGARGSRGGAMSPQSTPPSTPNFGRMLQQPEDEVNVEYLKNVLLSFMEHKERRVSIHSLYFLTLWVKVFSCFLYLSNAFIYFLGSTITILATIGSCGGAGAETNTGRDEAVVAWSMMDA